MANYIRMRDADISGTSHQTTVAITDSEMRALFGPPNDTGDGYKTGDEWHFADHTGGYYGRVVTVYKDLRSSSKSMSIGAHSKAEALDFKKELLKHYKSRLVTTQETRNVLKSRVPMPPTKRKGTKRSAKRRYT